MALPAPAERDDKNRIQSYQRMMDVLQCFTSVSRRLTLAQIAAGTGLPRPTVHRILGALKEIGFIEQDVRGGGYTDDCEKYSLLALEGWRVLRVTAKHIKSGQALAWLERALKPRRTA